MPDHQLAADSGDEIPEIGTVPNERHERTVLLVDRVPVGAMHRRIVEVLALDAPRLVEDLCPFGAWRDGDLGRRQIEQTVPDFCGALRLRDPPAISTRALRRPPSASLCRIRPQTFD